jgi:hypothetical protein
MKQSTLGLSALLFGTLFSMPHALAKCIQSRSENLLSRISRL